MTDQIVPPTHAIANVSLYVGDLNPDVNETQLFDIFKQAGPVASIRVCRDAVTRRSLGYAYINYHNPEDANRALDLLNYKDIRGRACRIMVSQRDPLLRRNNQGNIFIKNLAKTIDNKSLFDTFSQFGNILSCKIASDEHGNSRGYGFIHYDSQESADKASSMVNGKSLEGKQVYVGPFIPKKVRSKENPDSKWTNIYVKYLDPSINEEELRDMFSKYGTITSAVVVKDDQEQSKGFAFVNYETNEQAQKAIDDLNGKELNGKQLFVGRAQKKAEREKELKDMFHKIQRERMSKYQGVNLYVKNLDESIDDEQLRKEFSQSGTITSAKVMTDDKKTSKGFGFVCYSTPEEATKAVTELNGKIISGKPIYVALAQRKDQRRMALEQQFTQKAKMQPGMATPMFASPMYLGRGGHLVYPPNVAGPQGRFLNQQGRGVPMVGGFVVQGVQPGSSRGQNQPGRGRGGSSRGRGGQQVGIKYNQNVRNTTSAEATPEASVASGSSMPMTEERKTQIGDLLYPLVSQNLTRKGQDEQAGKVTGMILESMDQAELMNLLESEKALDDKVNEALDVLKPYLETNKQQ